MKIREIVRTVSAAVLVIVFSANQSWAGQSAAVQSQIPFVIPEELARIESIHAAGTLGPWVIHIQDPHCVIEAQENIQRLINYLENHYDVRFIYVEGAEGKLNTSKVKAASATRASLNDYLNLGQMSGAEMAAILSDKKSNYFGIEDANVLESNRQAFLAVIESREKRNAALQSMIREWNEARKGAYSSALVVSQEALDLDQTAAKIKLLISAANLELAKKDYDEFLQAYRTLLIRSARLKNLFAPVLKFYELVLARDEIMGSNILKRFQADKPQIAVVVTGGFHSEGVDKILQSKNISTVVVSPIYTHLKGQENYVPTLQNSKPVSTLSPIFASPSLS